MRQLCQGRLVWVEMLDMRGENLKKRPAIIISPTEEIQENDPDQEIWIIAASTKIQRCIEEKLDIVELEWHRDGHPRTKLREPTVAVCNWRAKIKQSAILRVAGILPGKSLYEIREILAEKYRSGHSDAS